MRLQSLKLELESSALEDNLMVKIKIFLRLIIQTGVICINKAKLTEGDIDFKKISVPIT